ncbi:hypothetical protein SPHINGOT1_660036 [Sphingomonas sp. T1]|nr:hypothetical protein SPHINGOT1_660036 [Sphingomonas sp. T1]
MYILIKQFMMEFDGLGEDGQAKSNLDAAASMKHDIAWKQHATSWYC